MLSANTRSTKGGKKNYHGTIRDMIVVISGPFIKFLLHNHIINKKKILFPAM